MREQGAPQRAALKVEMSDSTWLLPSMAWMQIAVTVRSFSDRNLTLSPRRP